MARTKVLIAEELIEQIAPAHALSIDLDVGEDSLTGQDGSVTMGSAGFRHVAGGVQVDLFALPALIRLLQRALERAAVLKGAAAAAAAKASANAGVQP